MFIADNMSRNKEGLDLKNQVNMLMFDRELRKTADFSGGVQGGAGNCAFLKPQLSIVYVLHWRAFLGITPLLYCRMHKITTWKTVT